VVDPAQHHDDGWRKCGTPRSSASLSRGAVTREVGDSVGGGYRQRPTQGNGEVRQPATGARGGEDGDSLRRGDGGLRTDTARTPSDGGSSWSLRKPCRKEDREVSTRPVEGGDVSALPVRRRCLQTTVARTGGRGVAFGQRRVRLAPL
jgi:hypothetical protein